MKTKIAISLCLLTLSSLSFAHGMNKYGPNGGYVKMPGAFHTELVDKGAKMHVYLLDMNFKNPTVINSIVKIVYKGTSNTEYSCSKDSNYFVCDKPSGGLMGYKEIAISAVRNNNKAMVAIYNLPLKLDK
ncbi:hypothetical protein DOM21_13050 [Bacteriovorax stolpii]|uniref:hypothetical protein n=1 Tax=Bacteriovorax stolpii TaxID=960 RepID=UPI00115B897E|nr:hypothetical protein [Bacteriovorax stolpii]QDK42354.1 hypothetical protein DOM21_13050 [Bacteriovorax stolpii]